ncbi:unnamed protein product [Cryptosporidium hominis]|uniref:Uncharacterized protein n=1 Tax=Cryptosporidium hominis TaxID=237895 RepID=A0A0S4TAN1_CRYHO|nr:hypothetical protein [Cryptosporidium hominis TU502]OLQ18644.1 hypothetical protein ChTU502y2012_412g0085 [Cryptosporidium hominis]PPA62892.1 hypothetical protein ChUKH1_18090 [Cryptosporidium hominis]PPS97330.1 Uncharacterized protein GY17_00001348 [Cryptosporidium hominis]CUV04290.1 unnamed protein product [Cryptosporidium hominis]|eukprot:PPS97330.1 Uncharacterized protein GY17_00001348 [Cryptosporidium hominis]
MNDNENIENLVGLLKKVERKQRREEFEKYRKASDEIQHELKQYLVKFHQIAKKSEKKALEQINSEYKQEERRIEESLEQIKDIEVQFNKINSEYEKGKKNLQSRISKLKEMYSTQLELIQEEERKELRILRKEMKNLLLLSKKEAYQFSKNNIKFGNMKIINLIKRISSDLN